uniref:Uncharacterized protein n=1 Tax=Culex tarsalis TaxID=7177 RepID=A0A1Q3FB14_CULTA
MILADPWCNPNPTSAETSDAILSAAQLQFEDNFEPAVGDQQQQPRDGRLPDSDSYLAALERRLKRIKTNPTVLQQLAERREACMQHLLNDDTAAASTRYDQLDEPVFNHELLRIIRPEQALSAAELAHLVKHDHLEGENQEEHQQQQQEGEESGTESSTSR